MSHLTRKNRRRAIARIKEYGQHHAAEFPGRTLRHTARMTLMGGGVESGWLNYGNYEVAGSAALPHDAMGDDHDSVGPLQQRVGYDGQGEYGWGKLAHCQTVEGATESFVAHLVGRGLQYTPRTAYAMGAAVQAVQGSAFPDRYESEFGAAGRFLALHWATTRARKSPRPVPKHDDNHPRHAAHRKDSTIATTTHTRTHTKLPLGRRKARGGPALDLAPLLDLTAAVPIVPSTVDYIAALHGGWAMLGNDEAGDCEAVRWANSRRITTTLLTDKPSYPSQAQVWQVYQRQNPKFVPGDGPHGYGSADDQGMDTQMLLEDLQANGGPDGVKLVAFGKIDPKNVAAVRAAIAIFGSVWVDILVLDGNQRQFAAGEPWTDDGSDVDGGHAVLGGGYPPAKIETWAAEAELADSFWTGTTSDGPLVEAVWVPIWPEHLGARSVLAGVDLAQLAADFHALTGKTLPAVVPAPSPVPPSPSPAPSGLTTRQFTALQEASLQVMADHPHAHGGYLEAAAMAWNGSTIV